MDGRIVLSMKPPGFYAEYKNVIDKEPTRSVKFSAHASLKYQSEKAMKADSKYKKGEEEEEKEEDEDEEEEEDEDEDIIFHKAPNTHLSNSFDLLGEED